MDENSPTPFDQSMQISSRANPWRPAFYSRRVVCKSRGRPICKSPQQHRNWVVVVDVVVCVCVCVSVVQRRLHTWSLRPSFVFSFIFFCLSSFPMLSNNSDDSKTRLERKVKTRLENHSLFFFLLPSLRIASWCEKVLFSTLYLFLFFSVVFCGAEIRKFRRRRMKWE